MFGISFADDGNFDLSPYKEGSTGGGNASVITEPTEKIAGVALGVIRVVGTGVAFVMITVIAIKYLLAAPGERADIKKSSVRYLIGALNVFASTNIISALATFVTNTLE